MTVTLADLSSKFFRTVRKRSVRYSLSFAFAWLLALVLTVFGLFNIDYLEAFTYDLRLRLRPWPQPSPFIHIVTIDPRTLTELRGYPNLRDHVKFLDAMKEDPPRAVVYAFSPLRILGAVSDSALFVSHAKALPNFMVASPDLPVTEQWERHRLSPPFEELAYIPAAKTTDKRSFAKDNFTRRQILTIQDKPLLDLELARLFVPNLREPPQMHGAFYQLMTWQSYIDFLPINSYDTTSFLDVLRNPSLHQAWKNDLVIVGIDTEDDSSDYAQTPLTHGMVDMTLAEVHANMVDTIVHNSAPIRAPRWVTIWITFILSLLTLNVALNIRPGRGLALLATLMGCFVGICYALFVTTGLWLPMAAPMVAMFISYYFFVPYRLIIENRRSWEYYQRNKILMQVEELKTNFVSMMSHDLKTPLARIQGMTDIIARDDNPLSHQQASALLSIQKSGEELSNFISSILDLGRIESREIKLQLISRDINALLEDVIHRHDFLAREKQVTVVKELEPLFSVRMDVELMRQVFSNILENAIKYSPQGGRVLITSEEDNGRIIVQIADQGVGIPQDDLPHVFLKFYRSKDARISTIKGSGLGLYLAKYFVELHNGTISVDSTVGVGTTFTVVLPMNSA